MPCRFEFGLDEKSVAWVEGFLERQRAGGAAGVASGLGIQHLVARLAGWPVAIQPQAIVMAVVFSALVGVGFGFYPALKASRLDPIEALRYE